MTMLPAAETKKITTPDGRELAYLEFGNPSSPLVIHNHGGPSSRLEGRLFADAAVGAGLRLVSVDRPGFGQSTPQPGRSYEGWAHDLIAIADALGANQFGVTGWSEGGPWALAAAAYLDPDRLRHVSDIAGAAYGAFGDDSAAKYLDKADALGGQLAIHHTMLFHWMYSLIELDAVHFTSSYVKTVAKTLNAKDAALLADPAIAEAFGAASAECFAQGADALVEDSELLFRKWAFDVTRIERPVHLWQGTEDHLVPFPINQELSERMPGTVWHPVEGEDHLLPIPYGAEIFAIAAKELSA